MKCSERSKRTFPILSRSHSSIKRSTFFLLLLPAEQSMHYKIHIVVYVNKHFFPVRHDTQEWTCNARRNQTKLYNDITATNNNRSKPLSNHNQWYTQSNFNFMLSTALFTRSKRVRVKRAITFEILVWWYVPFLKPHSSHRSLIHLMITWHVCRRKARRRTAS